MSERDGGRKREKRGTKKWTYEISGWSSDSPDFILKPRAVKRAEAKERIESARDRLEERAEKVETEDEQGSFARLHTCTYMVIPRRGGVSRI